ncbi:MAG: fructose-specific PTS transporter subunit EIIC [Eubacteriales bacterium]|nr:fructose-specific PTS transporter subunit EIIC [Lachnospiraceae bacterium]MDO5126240.1 fructose-specific PTS transporter subunit EIIC [Eubacteriales bacterium]
MRIIDLLDEQSISLDASAKDKKDALDSAVALMVKSGKINDEETYRAGVYAREEEGTTGIGEGIAIPHCKSDAVSKPGLAAMVFKDGVEFDSLDGLPVELLFLIAAPNTEDNVHLDVLSKLSMLLMDEDFTQKLKSAKSTKQFLEIIDAAEQKKDEKAEEVIKSEGMKLLAVTGCPTGIAHTYMAAESLEKKAAELGHRIKVETRGSGGAKNVLTKEEIAAADAIIVAADTQVPMDRFDGKRVIICKVADGISKAEELIKRAASGDAKLYQATGSDCTEASDDEHQSIGHQIYKHLMNGVSHMLPFVVGGGILIALAFLIDGLLVNLNNIPQDLIDKFGSVDAVKSNFGTLTPVAEFLKGKLGGVAFGFMLPVLAGYIAMSIADRPGLALGILGGAIAANGTSGFLGAIIAGFAAGYTVELLKKVFSGLPAAIDGLKPVLIYPLFGMLIVGSLMVFAIEPVVGWLNTGINNGLAGMSGANMILLGALLGGMMSVDMGGPVNKAAYAFGISQIAAGNYEIMAAVMIGGMVPPLAIAISTMLFKNKFTAEERKTGPTNVVMGLSFISEGAIPFAASDPLRVIPSCIIGSAISGALSAAFGCTLMAPHGGIFVFPVVGNAILYLLALLIGSVIGAVILGTLKKKLA